MVDLKGKAALVAGATGGLGRAIAEALAEAGCNLMLSGLGEPEEIERWRSGLERSHSISARYSPADLGRAEEIAAMMAQAEEVFGAIDIVMNNAVVRNFAAIEDLGPDAWEQALAVNLSSAFHTTRLALPGMKRRNFGRIVNMASAYSVLGASGRVDYVTTKTALLGLTRATALETADFDITCNAVCPGTVDTPAIIGKIRRQAEADGIGYEDAVRDYLAERQPGGEFIAAGNVAALIVFLCGPAGRDISGATLPVDRGWVVS